MAGKWNSKLTPHKEAIRLWRKAGKSYRDIAVLLWEEKNVQVHPDTINSFVMTRYRAAMTGRLMAELPDPVTPTTPEALVIEPTAAITTPRAPIESVPPISTTSLATQMSMVEIKRKIEQERQEKEKSIGQWKHIDPKIELILPKSE